MDASGHKWPLSHRSSTLLFGPASFEVALNNQPQTGQIIERIPLIGMAEDAFSGSFDSVSLPFDFAQGRSPSLRIVQVGGVDSIKIVLRLAELPHTAGLTLVM